MEYFFFVTIFIAASTKYRIKEEKKQKCSCLFVLTISETSIHSIQFEHWLIKRFKIKLALCMTTSMCEANFIHTCLQMAGICIAIKICI